MAVEKTFCVLVKEQIVDEKHAADFYDHMIEKLTRSGIKSKSWESVELTTALLEKIGTDERSHFKILEVIDKLLCHG